MAPSTIRGALAGLILVSTAKMAMAHEHNEDEIPEGSGVSAEPLVSFWQGGFGKSHGVAACGMNRVSSADGDRM